jgi:hypothetical protein
VHIHTLAFWKKAFRATFRFVKPAALKYSISTNAVPANMIAWNSSKLSRPAGPVPVPSSTISSSSCSSISGIYGWTYSM